MTNGELPVLCAPIENKKKKKTTQIERDKLVCRDLRRLGSLLASYRTTFFFFVFVLRFGRLFLSLHFRFHFRVLRFPDLVALVIVFLFYLRV